MNRRSLFSGIGGLVGIFAVPSVAIAAAERKCFKQDQNSVNWTVPKDIKKIRVQSWTKEGNEVIDTHFTVRPGQTFNISVVKT